MDRREAKRQLRRELFSRHREKANEEKALQSRSIRARIETHPTFQEARVVAAYVALPNEPDLDPLIESELANRRWCLPRVTGEGQVEMREVRNFDQLVMGDFKIREPDPAICPLVSLPEIDLILLPGVGFDSSNLARLGRGKGHYDRFLAGVRGQETPPMVWGICFSSQLVSIEPEPHDQPVDAIISSTAFTV